MTINSPEVFDGPFDPNGATTNFPFTFEITGYDGVVVEIDGAEIDASLYTVTLNDDGSGEVEFLTAPLGAELKVFTDPSFKQEASLRNQGPYFQETIEAIVDSLAVRALWLKDAFTRSFHIPRGETATELPAWQQRANKILGFDGLGNPEIVSGIRTDLGVIDDGIWLETDAVADDAGWTAPFSAIVDDGAYA